jgi:putative membrane protein
LIFFTLPYLYFRFHTLRYRFDEEGIHMKVGLLFRQEINLTYARIQDIHLRSGVIQRWLGLASVEIQTASGATAAELVIEGFKEYDFIRDFLYTRMRGYHLQSSRTTDPQALQGAVETPAGSAIPGSVQSGEIVSLLLQIRDELRQTRQMMETKNSQNGRGSTDV